MMRMRDMRPGFMREHMWTRRHLPEYLDDELDARDRERLDRHASLCPKCGHLVATLLKTLRELRTLRRASPPSSPVADSVIARLREETP